MWERVSSLPPDDGKPRLHPNGTRFSGGERTQDARRALQTRPDGPGRWGPDPAAGLGFCTQRIVPRRHGRPGDAVDLCSVPQGVSFPLAFSANLVGPCLVSPRSPGSQAEWRSLMTRRVFSDSSSGSLPPASAMGFAVWEDTGDDTGDVRSRSRYQDACGVSLKRPEPRSS